MLNPENEKSAGASPPGPFARVAPQAFIREVHGVRMEFERFSLRDGLSLLKARVSVPSGREAQLPLNPQRCHLGCMVSGKAELHVSGTEARRVCLSSGSWFVASASPLPLTVMFGEELRLITVESDHSGLMSFFSSAGYAERMMAGRLLHADPSVPVFLSGQGQGQLFKLSVRISGETGDTFAGRLALESLALRWLAELLAQPALHRDRTCAAQCPTADEQAVRSAARVLEEHLDAEHSIVQLSRRVHLNEFKLKRGFRVVYGTTIMGYLRDKRMQRAAELLQSGPHSVMEVAGLVGYTNASHFARAFKAAHGILPKRYQKENGRLARISSVP